MLVVAERSALVIKEGLIFGGFGGGLFWLHNSVSIGVPPGPDEDGFTQFPLLQTFGVGQEDFCLHTPLSQYPSRHPTVFVRILQSIF